MSLVISNSLVLSAEEEALPDGTPIIGYHDIVTTANIDATSEAAGSPVTNLANPSTNLLWVSSPNSPATGEYITVTTNYVGDIDYVGIARHNFGSAGIPFELQGGVANTYQKIMLHLDGGNSPDLIVDSNAGGSAHTWTTAGNAFQDTTDYKFGGGSLKCDGTGDYVTMADHADLTLGSGDWTVSFWFKCNAAGGTVLRICGQSDNAGTTSTTSFVLVRNASNFIVASACVGSTAFTVTGTSQFTDAVNAGWNHCAFVRTGNTLKLFLNGTQEGGDVAISGTVNDSSNNLSVGRRGELAGLEWNGWIDEFELLVGVALYTADFVVPAIASDGLYYSVLVQDTVVGDDSPLILQFTPGIYTSVRLWLQPGSAAPQAAVMYVGKLLVMERGIKIETDHVPITYGRVAKVVNGFSESGNFLGRVVTQQHRQSKAEFAHITPTWYRSHLDDFIVASKTEPFFYAWQPDTYPLETGFCWMVNDPMPATNPVTRRVAIEFEMRGVT